MLFACSLIEGALSSVPAGMIVIVAVWFVHGRLLPQVLQNAVAK
jgi:hypothetical protein